MEPVGVGLVGAGAFGVFCLDAFAEMPDVRIVAVADTDYGRAQAAAAKHHAQAYRTLEQMLNDPAVEIVALNTPPFLHAEEGLAVVRAGRHLFGEKPLTLTLDQASRLLEEARRSDVRLTVDYVMRRNPFWDAAARLRHDGILGRLLHMDLINHAAGLDLPAEHWFWKPALSGGIWIEHGVHFFDAFSWVSGEEGVITGAQSFQRADGAVDRVECIAKFGETAAHCYHGFTHSGKTEQTTVRLAFEHGYVTLREWVPTSIEIVTPIAPEAMTPYLPGTAEPISTAWGTMHRMVSRAPEGKSAVYQACIQAGMSDLAQAVRDPQHQLSVTGREGYNSLRLAVEATEWG
jgi:predicted dehydrogenase